MEKLNLTLCCLNFSYFKMRLNTLNENWLMFNFLNSFEWSVDGAATASADPLQEFHDTKCL